MKRDITVVILLRSCSVFSRAFSVDSRSCSPVSSASTVLSFAFSRTRKSVVLSASLRPVFSCSSSICARRSVAPLSSASFAAAFLASSRCTAWLVDAASFVLSVCSCACASISSFLHSSSRCASVAKLCSFSTIFELRSRTSVSAPSENAFSASSCFVTCSSSARTCKGKQGAGR